MPDSFGCVFIDERPSGGVDKEGRRLHESQLFRASNVSAARGQDIMGTKNVGCFELLFFATYNFKNSWGKPYDLALLVRLS